jgi:hypothetical protein
MPLATNPAANTGATGPSSNGPSVSDAARGVASSQAIEGEAYRPSAEAVQRSVEAVEQAKRDGTLDAEIEAARAAVGHPAAKPSGMPAGSLDDVSAPNGDFRRDGDRKVG